MSDDKGRGGVGAPPRISTRLEQTIMIGGTNEGIGIPAVATLH